MGLKLGPKIELSFWDIGYIVVSIALLIFNLTWISSSLSGILLGIKERAVYKTGIHATTSDHITAIEDYLKSSNSLALRARAARLDYNLKSIDKSRELYKSLVSSPDKDVATRAQISLITLDFENVPFDANKNGEAKMAAAAAGLTALDKLAKENPNSLDVLAAQGALHMFFFNAPSHEEHVAAGRAIVAAAQKLTAATTGNPVANPGTVEVRRNLLLLELAVKNFDPPANDDEKKIVENHRAELKKIAPYIGEAKKTPLVNLLEELAQCVKDGTVGVGVLAKIKGLGNLKPDEFSALANTVACAVVPTLNSPKGRENQAIAIDTLKNAEHMDAANTMNYTNGAALDVMMAMVVDQQLDQALASIGKTGPLPVPFGNSDKAFPEVSGPVTDMDRLLNDAYEHLKAGCAQTTIDKAVRARWCERRVDIALWRAAISTANTRLTHLREALDSAVLWFDNDPKNCTVLVRTAEIYDLLGKPDDAKKYADQARGMGCQVVDRKAGGNRLELVTVYPGNPLPFGTSDFSSRGWPVLVGGTFVVEGYTNPVDKDSVKVTLNGQALTMKYYEGIVYALVKTDRLTPRNELALKISLTPQISQSKNQIFRYIQK